MVEETDFFLSQDGLKMHYRRWENTQPEAMLCIVHGLGEHSARYTSMAEHLTSQGIAVFAMDLRGHGLSGGKKGHAKSYEHLLSDIEELLKSARASHTDIPMFLMGHSLGGNMVANYMIRMNTNEIEGFILSSPWLQLAFEPPALEVKVARVVAGILPSFSQANGLNAKHLSKDQQVVEKYLNDPLVHDKISAGMFIQAQQAGSYALEHASEVDKKGLIYHGDQDKITSWKATRSFAESCPHCEWKLLKGVYHEPHNDLEKEEVLALLTTWIKNSSH